MAAAPSGIVRVVLPFGSARSCIAPPSGWMPAETRLACAAFFPSSPSRYCSSPCRSSVRRISAETCPSGSQESVCASVLFLIQVRFSVTSCTSCQLRRNVNVSCRVCPPLVTSTSRVTIHSCRNSRAVNERSKANGRCSPVMSATQADVSSTNRRKAAISAIGPCRVSRLRVCRT